MIDVVALLEARSQTSSAARSALPDAPVRPERDPAPSRPVAAAGRIAALRLRASLGLRRLADRIEPAPTAPRTAAPC